MEVSGVSANFSGPVAGQLACRPEPALRSPWFGTRGRALGTTGGGGAAAVSAGRAAGLGHVGGAPGSGPRLACGGLVAA